MDRTADSLAGNAIRERSLVIILPNADFGRNPDLALFRFAFEEEKFPGWIDGIKHAVVGIMFSLGTSNLGGFMFNIALRGTFRFRAGFFAGFGENRRASRAKIPISQVGGRGSVGKEKEIQQQHH